MEKEAKFVQKTMEDTRQLIVEKGFRLLKLVDVLNTDGISRTKFFSYFGGFHDLIELVLRHEILQRYKYIQSRTKGIQEPSLLLKNIIAHRQQYISKNELLTRYYNEEKDLPRRFDGLKKAISSLETSLIRQLIQPLTASKREYMYLKEIILKNKQYEVSKNYPTVI
ncbi:MAG: TetR/AcrR family transcriptional regulator [Sphingobacterium sp.]|jgi:AcrR family transcriptional regulator|nr:TetR/AcrR family transcriptional regulator [Sphingobacterium sp.]